MSGSPDVLIVEDEAVVLQAVTLSLRSHGISSDSAGDVLEAGRRLERARYKVIVTDLKLPGSSGFDLLDMAAKISPPPQVVLITGYATIDNALESFRRGAFDFLPKPFDVDELISVVDRAQRFFNTVQDPTKEVGGPGADDPERHYLGRHAWAKIEPDGSAVLGLAETLASVMGELTSINFVTGDENTVQGQCLCQLTAANKLVHRVWSPLSGRIIHTNQELQDHLDSITREPFSAGWLARIVPTNLEEELPWLGRQQNSLSGRGNSSKEP